MMYRRHIFVLFLTWLSAQAASAQPAAPVAYIAFTDGYWQVWLTDTADGEPVQVSRSTYDKNRLSWYPDGRHLLVNGNQGELYRLDTRTGSETPVELPLEGMNDAVLSPDGSQIAFSLSTADSRDGNDIWLVGTDGSNLIRLTRMKWLQHDPVWSRDSRWIYFLSSSGRHTRDIWKVSTENQTTEKLTSSSVYLFDIALSRTGEMAFSSNRAGNYDVWLQRGSQEPRQLTSHAAFDGRPAWSPDDSELLFESSRGGTTNLWRLKPGEGQPVQLTHHDQGAHAPVWFGGGVTVK